MPRHTETISQSELAKHNPDQRQGLFIKMAAKFYTTFGPGDMMTEENSLDGSTMFHYDYAEKVPGSGLTDIEIDAIAHARVIMCNHGGVQLDRITGLYTELPGHAASSSDPAFPKRLHDINVLESLCSRHGRPTVIGQPEG